MQRGGWRSGDTIPQPQQQIQAGFAVAVEALLSPEQAARYADETAKREANRRRVAVQSVVARLDQNLRLSAEQRERLCASLPEHWKDSWSQQLWIGNENLPPIPEKAVATILNPAQLKIWKSIPKSGDVMFFGVRFGFMGMQGEEVGADDEDDLGRALKELAEKKPDEPKPAEKTE
jgi:hypothetical protein